MSTALVSNSTTRLQAQEPAALPPVPWRDPHSVLPGELTAYIRKLEEACLANPQSAELRTCLGMAHAVNYDVYKSMDALEDACTVDPDNFWAQLKYAELHYRLRALNRAEQETRRAADLATNAFQLAMARKQMQDIRTLKHGCIRNVEWTKPLTVPAVVLSAMVALMFVAMMWK
jgi:cytochrome c-type biogenesis protein CcmH/NrfG